MTKIAKLPALSILSLSLSTMATGATAGTISEIGREFTQASQATVELTVTMPSMTMAIFIIISNFLIKKTGTKKVIIAGLTLVLLSTILSLVSPTIGMLLVARALLGAGIGLFNSLAVSLIDYLYQGQIREKLLGYQNTFQGIGATVGALLVSGLLAIFNWRLAFAIYLISVPILFLNWRYVPNVNYAPQKSQASPAHLDVKMAKSAKWAFGYYFGILFCLMVAYMTINVKVPSLIVDQHLSTPAVGSMAIVVMSIGTIIGGAAYGKVLKLLGNYMMAVVILLMVAAFLTIGFGGHLSAVLVGTFIVGGSFGLYVPLIFSRALSIVPPARSNDGSTLLLIGSNLANFLCPYIDKALNPGRDESQLFLMVAMILGVVLVIEFVKSIRVRESVTG